MSSFDDKSRANVPAREEIALSYFEQLPFTPYPVQEKALWTWFESKTGVLVCTPTGTGKTLIAEAAAFEALRTGKTMYYTTPLIALTEQKFAEMQRAAAAWGFHPDQVGLVTGNRRVNPDAQVLVVVAEILLNRLLHPEMFDFSSLFAVVMDEFHSFSDPERGIVWEFALALLPKHVRLLLLSATVGNAVPFLGWLRECHGRDLDLVQGTERRVPLTYQWVPDKLLNELLEELAIGTNRPSSSMDDGDPRRTPALVFCFNRDECWSVAEQLKGKAMLGEGQQKQLVEQLAKYDWSKGAGPKFKQILMRGVGVHHAGILPRYKRVVEDLFQKKLLSVCVCTETLAAGINLPARSVVLPSLIKGKPGKQRLLEPSAAHQMFGRAGRPQFDSHGYVYALPHEDDVKILRWREKYDQIPADSKDPGLMKARKALEKKKPTRSPERQYWNQQQFEKLQKSPPGDLVSRGPLPWRLLAYLLQLSPELDRVRVLARKRLMEPKQLEIAERQLDRMLLTLHRGGYVKLEPEPPAELLSLDGMGIAATDSTTTAKLAEPAAPKLTWVQQQLQAIAAEELNRRKRREQSFQPGISNLKSESSSFPSFPSVQVVSEKPEPPRYRPEHARPTDRLAQVFAFRSVNPLYGMFLLDHFDLADERERMQMWESVLEFTPTLLRVVRTPPYHKVPPGPLATTRIDPEIIQRGILPAGDLYPVWDPDIPFEERKYAPALADKLKMLFNSRFPDVSDVFVAPVWVAGELLEFGGDFFSYISGRDLAKQEGLIFRHVLRLILLLGEFSQLTPPNVDPVAWREELRMLALKLTDSCRAVDPNSTDSALQHAADVDIVRGETAQPAPVVELFATAIATESGSEPAATIEEFGAGILESDET
jgi:superfamily II DNA/RNA helicase